MSTERITIELTDANAFMVKNLAAVLKKPKSEVISFCLRGSTNPMKWQAMDIKKFCREVQPTSFQKNHKENNK